MRMCVCVCVCMHLEQYLQTRFCADMNAFIIIILMCCTQALTLEVGFDIEHRLSGRTPPHPTHPDLCVCICVFAYFNKFLLPPLVFPLVSVFFPFVHDTFSLLFRSRFKIAT